MPPLYCLSLAALRLQRYKTQAYQRHGTCRQRADDGHASNAIGRGPATGRGQLRWSQRRRSLRRRRYHRCGGRCSCGCRCWRRHCPAGLTSAYVTSCTLRTRHAALVGRGEGHAGQARRLRVAYCQAFDVEATLPSLGGDAVEHALSVLHQCNNRVFLNAVSLVHAVAPTRSSA